MNLQKQERKLALRDKYSITKIFKTIQGEGPFTGHPAIFIRLAGCNLQCPQCDTEYTSRIEMSIDDIYKQVVREMSKFEVVRSKLIVITGGEPFRQYIGPLVGCLRSLGYYIQIETNGTFIQPGPWGSSRISIVCSPKTPKLNAELLPNVKAFKYVIDRHNIDEKDGLPTSVLGYDIRPARPKIGVPVYISPADVNDPAENILNMKAAAEICMRYGYILSLQTHKIVGLE